MDSLRRVIQTRLGERMTGMNSTLVETVSINYEDFNESFLTCGTCLCVYDGEEHTPKLLQCSHTVCLHCLTRIAASQTRDTGSFRCPICRELITIPRGGVAALPPSFLVNQLLDLMSRQRREVIPKCSVHINQELLFCETCDTVFCTICTKGSHNDSADTCEHTVIPFSIAIKRMSEILLYKANECISKLNKAQEKVRSELQRLDSAREANLEQISIIFQQIQSLVDKRKQEMIENVNSICTEKRKILEEQHSLIESEKNKVEGECQGLQYQVEVRNITQRIESLSEKLDVAITLNDPRENAFLMCDFKHNDTIKLISQQLNSLGRVRTSTTFPSLCTAEIETENVTVGIESHILLTTMDYHGNSRNFGGDPVKATLSPNPAEGSEPTSLEVIDCDNGTYRIKFRVAKAGNYNVKITIFDRPIKEYPISFEVTEHNNPVTMFGTKGSGKEEFMQPVAVAVDDTDNIIYVLDTGNSRIKVLDRNFSFIKHITNEGLLGRSCTGISLSNNGLVVINWRTKCITEMTEDGNTVRTFTHGSFSEPIDIAVDRTYGHILVADNGTCCIFVFDEEGKYLFQVGSKDVFKSISSVAIGPDGEIVVADSEIKVFSAKGDFLKVVSDGGKGKGRYGSISVDSENRILASKTDHKGKSYLQILSIIDDSLNSYIDSQNSKLKRPSGVAVTNDNHVIVVDLGNNCIKKYRYW
ncbi:tripartite motif-containing protein 2-like isoform X2 [Coccinella septempunctata]|uniref:tripartite motif-containing protein 2-like isoform X2 n=1 Tax=Coccinella septempunctata TaxID=41139 RepID=UPI001D063EF0|nr:tripartite motif-containing protein 2-like isoform X2 [Coccinella septempunctata]